MVARWRPVQRRIAEAWRWRSADDPFARLLVGGGGLGRVGRGGVREGFGSFIEGQFLGLPRGRGSDLERGVIGRLQAGDDAGPVVVLAHEGPAGGPEASPQLRVVEQA